LGDFLTEMGEKATFLFGVLADKDVEEMLRHLRPHAAGWVLTTPPSPRAMRPEEVAGLVRGEGESEPVGENPGVGPSEGTHGAGHVEFEVEPEPTRALGIALAKMGGLLIACGSIYLLGDLRIALRERFGVPGRAVDGIF
jgi:folylpolyglutamate synthase/dihydropteroate synthase